MAPNFLLAIARLLIGVTVNAGSMDQAVQTGAPAQEHEMIAIAVPIVSLMDEGHFVETWKSVGPPITSKTDQAGWVAYLSALRSPLGAIKQRELKGFGFCKEMDGAVGEFAVVGFEAQFEHVSPIEEKIVFQKRAEKWELVGYWLKKRILTWGKDQPSPN